MGIKNFTVITQRLKDKSDGLISYIHYLKNVKAKSHAETKIIPLHLNSDAFLSRTILNTVNFDNKNKKGGRKVESYAQSFNLVLPNNVNKPTAEQWRGIYQDIIKEAAKTLDLDYNELHQHSFANVHDQKNPHLNIVIPRIFKDQRLDKLDQKKTIGAMKKAFNASVLKRCGIDFKTYTPFDQNLGKRRKKWQYEQKKAEETRKKLLEEQKKMEEATQAQIDKILHVTQNLENASIEAEQKMLDAHKSILELNALRNAFNKFMTNIKEWIRTTKEKDSLYIGFAKNDTIDSVEELQKHPKYDDTTEDVVFEVIASAEAQTGLNDVSNNVKRKRRRYNGP